MRALCSFSHWLLSCAVLFHPVAVRAQNAITISSAGDSMQIGFGSKWSFGTMADRVITYLGWSILWISLTMFLIGAFLLTAGGISEGAKSRGKDLMIGSLIGMAVVLGSYALYRIVIYVLCGNAGFVGGACN